MHAPFSTSSNFQCYSLIYALKTQPDKSYATESQRLAKMQQNFQIRLTCWGVPRSEMASTPDSHAGGLGFKSRCRPTNFRPVWSPKSIPIPRLKSKNGNGFPEEGKVGDEGLWFWRAQREAKKKINVHTTTRHTVLVKHKEKSTCMANSAAFNCRQCRCIRRCRDLEIGKSSS